VPLNSILDPLNLDDPLAAVEVRPMPASYLSLFLSLSLSLSLSLPLFLALSVFSIASLGVSDDAGLR